MHFIEFSHVSKIYRKGFFAKKVPAVVDCSFSVDRGKVTGFVGPNGAGKTTSIKMILGLVRPTSGTIRVAGQDPGNPLCRRDIAYISEQPYCYPHLTVSETLVFAAKLHGRVSSGLTKECDRALSEVGLEAAAKRKIKDLSKGMQQRCCMAAAMLLQAGALVLDEPLSGLDPLGRILFRDILHKLSEKGTTIFFSTHILDDVETLCHDVVALSSGAVAFNGPIAEVIAKGIKGTDVVAGGLGQELSAEFSSRGWELTDLNDGSVNIFIPGSEESLYCQRRLLENNVACSSIVKRSTPLEEILYR